MTRARKSLFFSSLALALLCLCSCATNHPADLQLPPDVTMNPEAGRGGLLLVTFRLANRKKLPMVVDTGSPITAFDKSLEPELGRRLDSVAMWNFGAQQQAGVYAVPTLYLGKFPLQLTGTNVATFDRHQLADSGWMPFMGFLGMDVLQNYCVQMDFAAGKLRFLDSAHSDKTNWGIPFPLTDVGDGCFSISENLAGLKGSGSIIDTGCDSSGWLRPEVLREWTNQAASGKIHSPEGMLGGEIYHDLNLRALDAKALSTNDTHTILNGIGLRLLSENLVTFDFPNRVMYLKRVSDWPLINKHEMATLRTMGKSSLNFLIRLKRKNQLPGASRNDHGRTKNFHFSHYDAPYLDSATWDLLKNGDPGLYHYTLTRSSRHGSWKLQKAWRTDENDKVLEEYPVP